MASPLVAGGAALVIEAYENTHGGVRPTPALVKQILTSSASDLDLPADQQGAGELNTYRAVRTAMSVKDGNGAPKAQGDGLVATTGGGDTQISMIGDAGSKQSASVTLTNTSPNTQTVSADVRELDTTVANVTGTKAVDFTDPNSPWFFEGYTLGTPGLKRHWFSTTFTVPAGADHLTGSATCACAGTSTLLRLVLVGPNGEYENWNSPQGTTNFAQVDQANPPAGKWTAYFYANANATGFKGDVHYNFLATKFKNVGSVSPANAVLKSGQSQKFTVAADAGQEPRRRLRGAGLLHLVPPGHHDAGDQADADLHEQRRRHLHRHADRRQRPREHAVADRVVLLRRAARQEEPGDGPVLRRHRTRSRPSWSPRTTRWCR